MSSPTLDILSIKPVFSHLDLLFFARFRCIRQSDAPTDNGPLKPEIDRYSSTQKPPKSPRGDFGGFISFYNRIEQ
jgi:hypothetical protein